MAFVLPELLSRYFEATDAHDVERLVALFADPRRRGRHAPRPRRDSRPGQRPRIADNYRTELFSTEAIRTERYLVAGRLIGDFPGGIADLTWEFTIADRHFARLVIAP